MREYEGILGKVSIKQTFFYGIFHNGKTRHENSWRHGRHASGTGSRKMRNHDAEEHKFANL